jgi:hypothetical protein
MDGKVAVENCLLVSILAHNGMESDTHLVCNITISKRTSQNNLILFSNERVRKFPVETTQEVHVTHGQFFTN